MSAKKSRIPSYRRHSSGQARVTLDGKDCLLGPYGSKESREAYDRLIAEWLVNRGRTPTPTEEQEAEPLSVNELILGYWKFAAEYYGFEGGERGDAYCLRDALRVVRGLYGSTPAQDFGPLALKACRSQMVKKGWSRNYVNAQVDRVRRMFRWAAEEELLPGSVHDGLAKVASLRKGKCEARESEKVRPVPDEVVDATLPYLQPIPRAMVELQRLTGMRPGEVCRLRGIDLEVSGQVWIYRPGSDRGPEGDHKTAHHGHERIILIGPRAQDVLRPWLKTDLSAYLFSPKEAESLRNAARRQARKSPMTPSQAARKPKQNPKRPRADRYRVAAYATIYPVGGDILAVEVDYHPLIAKKLAAIPGVLLVQDGDHEVTFRFPLALFEQVAAVVRPRRRRHCNLNPDQIATLADHGRAALQRLRNGADGFDGPTAQGGISGLEAPLATETDPGAV